MNSYEINFRYYCKTPDTIYLPAENYAEAFSNAHKYINPFMGCREIVVKRVSKKIMAERNVNYAMQNWRVVVNYLSKDRDDAALETSTPFYSEWRAVKEYEKIVESGEKCVDDRTKPVRVKLTHYVWNDGRNITRTECLRANYEEAYK